MDNPNVKAPRRNVHARTTSSVSLRRHKSLPGPLLRSIRPQRRSTTPSIKAGASPNLHHLYQSKLNPYVGWFRHSPPPNSDDSSGSKHVMCWLDPSTVMLKKRRYMAKGHHFRAMDHDQRILHIKELLSLKEKLLNSSSKHDLCWQDLLKQRGHLRGGGKDEQDLETFLQEQFAAGSDSSVTVKALSRLACWFLDVPIESPPPLSKCVDQDSAALVMSDDEDDDLSENDNYDTVGGSRQRRQSLGEVLRSTEGFTTSALESSNTVLSSQAEAHYALTAVCSQLLLRDEWSTSTNDHPPRYRSSLLVDYDASTSSSSSSRLDYEITQMDIVRMNRIASRHLDVESIVRLPVLTYNPAPGDSSGDTTISPEDERRDESRIHAHVQYQHEEASVSSREEKFDTEFSWMLVPTLPETRSFDDSATDHSSRHHHQHHQDSVVAATNLPIVLNPPPEEKQQHRDLCVICLEHFVLGDRLRVLPCTHSFHVGCIDRWLSGSHSFEDCYTAGCPTCKKRPTTTATTSRPFCFNGVPQQQQQQLDGSVPSWAFARIGDALARESSSQHF